MSELDNVPKVMITRYSQLATEKADDVYRYIFIGDNMNMIQSPNEVFCPPLPPIASDRLRQRGLFVQISLIIA